MPEDFLQELETAPPVVASLENIEDLARKVVGDVECAVEGMKGSALTFENAWRGIIMDVAKGQTAEIQAARPRLLSAFQKRLSLLKQTHALATWLHELGSANMLEPDVLLPEIAGMERLRTCVFEYWQSAGDLERLAVVYYPLSQTRLEQIASTHTPPSEWYQGEEERFFEE